MARIIARIAPAPASQIEWLRMAIVSGCAMALIAAGQAIPFIG
jgi:hypothetical protein